MKTLTVAWLTKHNACPEGIVWFQGQPARTPHAVLTALIHDGNLDWANWLIVRVMTYRQYVAYAIFAAEQMLAMYEHEYPDDLRPRHAIEAAKACLAHPSRKNKAWAAGAAWAAEAAAGAAGAAWAAAGAAGAAEAATMQRKILDYGMGLLS